MTLIPDRLAALDDIELHKGSHGSFDSGHCAMEVVAWLADEGHTDAPQCASPVLAAYTIRLNDRWDSEQRQALKPYLPRMVGTGGDGKDEIRRRIAAKALCSDLLPAWLRLAGMDEDADLIESMVDAPASDLRSTLYDIRSRTWAKRSERYQKIRALVREKLQAKGSAVADADADAVAVADAVADAVAVADAAAVAAAAAVAVADAVADAAADAVANAVADASPWSRYDAAYKAARQYYRDNPLVLGKVAELAAQQQPIALDVLDRMIAAEATR